MKYGNDGVGYDPKKHQQNLQAFANDKNLYQQELDRVKGVISNRQNSGMDNTKQLNYLKELQSIQPKPNPSQMINDLYNQQKQAQLAQLQASRDKAIGQLNQQRAELAPKYQGMKNQSDIVTNQNANRLREIMMANGLGASGENVSANVALQTERQNSLNSLNLQEQQQNNDISRRIADINNPDSENALIAQLEAERARALLGQFNNDRQFGLQEAGVTGNYNGGQTLAALNAARQFALQEGGLLGNYNGMPTLQVQGFNYQQERDQVADQWRQIEFDEDVRRFGLNHALDRQRASSGGSSGGLTPWQQIQLMEKYAEQEYEKLQQYIKNNEETLQQSIAAPKPMDYLLKQRQAQEKKPTFTGGPIDRYTYLR